MMLLELQLLLVQSGYRRNYSRRGTVPDEYLTAAVVAATSNAAPAAVATARVLLMMMMMMMISLGIDARGHLSRARVGPLAALDCRGSWSSVGLSLGTGVTANLTRGGF